MPLNRETIITLGSKLAPAAITFGRLRTLFQEPHTELESIVDLVRRSARVARFALDLPGESGHWTCDPAKLVLAGVSESDLATCASRVRDLYAALCTSVE